MVRTKLYNHLKFSCRGRIETINSKTWEKSSSFIVDQNSSNLKMKRLTTVRRRVCPFIARRLKQ